MSREAAAIGQGKGQFAGLPGKGMGKGIKGACWNCGGKGHRASECNQAQKGKGKGKFGGKFGPGELKGGKKGGGKGLYDVQYSESGKGAWTPGAGELSQWGYPPAGTQYQLPVGAGRQESRQRQDS